MVEHLLKKLVSGDPDEAVLAAAALAKPERAAGTVAALPVFFSSLDGSSGSTIGLWKLFSVALPEILKDERVAPALFSAVEELYVGWFSISVKETMVLIDVAEVASAAESPELQNSALCGVAFELLLREWHFYKHSENTGRLLLSSLERVLMLPSEPCQRAALAGLGKLFLTENHKLEKRRREILSAYLRITDSQPLKFFAARALVNHAGA